MSFNPNEHLMNLKGKQYLPVSARLVWFRQDHPDWSIVTTPIQIDTEKQHAIFSASIMDATGRIVATATKMENIKGFGDWLEKAETGSVGRALAMCGYGTQFAPEFDEGTERIVDAPQPARPRTDPDLVAAKTKFATRAHELGYAVTDENGKFSKALFYDVYRSFFGNPDTDTAAQWDAATAQLNAPERM